MTFSGEIHQELNSPFAAAALEEPTEEEQAEEEKKEDVEEEDGIEDDWCFGESFDNASMNSSSNNNNDLLVECLPPQLHPAVSLGMKRVSSAYFSLHESSWGSEADLFSLSSEYQHGSCCGGEETAAATQVVDANWLYHDIMMHVFTFLDAKSLAAFSETARRSNFECFYFLQLQLQRALLVGEDRINNKFQQQQQQQLQISKTSEHQHNHEDDRLATIAGSWAISRLASLDKEEAKTCVQEYLDSNSTLKTMPLSHSLAYIRQVLRRNGFPSQPQEAPALAAKAAMLVTLVGAATVISGNVEVADSFGTELPNMLFKVGFVGSLMNAARRKWEEKQDHHQPNRVASSESMNNANWMFESVLSSTNNPNSSETTEEVADAANHAQHQPQFQSATTTNATTTTTNPDASISRRMYDAFRQAASVRTLSSPLATLQEHEDESADLINNHQDPQPRTPNPYEHLPAEEGRAATENDIKEYTKELNGKELAALDDQSSDDPKDLQATENTAIKVPRKMPSGCVGAYFRAIRRATNSITRIVKEQRKARFNEIPDKQLLARSFIDACCSDSGLPIVKNLVQERGIIDAEGFYCGSDGTETCALHAAAFHGATQVLEFLVGGIDERDPSKDQGLCDVDLICPESGWTALHFAAGANCVQSVRILADRGANLCVTAENGYTPLQWAQRLSNQEVAAELRERLEQSDPYYKSNHPWTSQPLSAIAHRFFAMIPAR